MAMETKQAASRLAPTVLETELLYKAATNVAVIVSYEPTGMMRFLSGASGLKDRQDAVAFALKFGFLADGHWQDRDGEYPNSHGLRLARLEWIA